MKPCSALALMRSIIAIISPRSAWAAICAEVGDYAFYECYILVGVTYDGTPDEWEQISMGQGNAILTDAARNYLGN